MADYDVLGLRGSEPSVRIAERSDAPTLAAIHHRAWHNAYGAKLPESLTSAVSIEACEAAWREEVATERAWVATADGLAVGAMSVATGDGKTDSVTEVTALYVDPLHQRKGHASRLLNQAAQLGRDATPAPGAPAEQNQENTSTAPQSLITAWVLAADGPRLEFFRSAGMAPQRRKRELQAPGLAEPLTELYLTAEL